jgi:hypothetical protein
MSSSRLLGCGLIAAVSLVVTVVACGPNSKRTIDAKVYDDAPGSGTITGLGQACVSDVSCPTSAPHCVAIALGPGSSSPMFCTATCDTGATTTTNGSGQFSNQPSAYSPPPTLSDCSNAYQGGAGGVLACELIQSYSPMDNPPKASTMYTMVTIDCLVACGSAAPQCPTGMTCDTTTGLCFPG